MNMKHKEFFISLIFLISTGLYVNIVRYDRVITSEKVNLDNFPIEAGDWKMTKRNFLSAKVLDVLKSDEEIMRKYVNSQGDHVWIFLAYFRDQKYGEQIHSPKHCLPGSGWNIKQTKSLKFTDPVKFEANRLVINQKTEEEIMVYWFCTQHGIIRNEYQLKIDLAISSLLRKPSDAAFIRINIRNVKKADDIIFDFVQTFYPQIQRILPF